MNNLSLAFKERLTVGVPVLISGLALGAASLDIPVLWVWSLWAGLTGVYLLLVVPYQQRKLTILGKLHATMSSAAKGDLDTRVTGISTADKLADIAWDLNEMLDQVESCLRESITTSKYMAKGEFFRRAQPEGLKGTFNIVMQGLNSSSAKVEQVMLSLNTSMQKLAAGDFSATESHPMEGQFAVSRDYMQAVQGALAEAITAINQSMAAIAQGQMDLRVEAQVPGELDALKQNVNTCIDQLNRTFTAIADTADAISRGDLTVKVEGNYQGGFADIQTSLNQAVAKLSALIDQLLMLASIVETGANEISAGNADLSKRTESQAATLEEVAATMEEMTSSVRQSADNAGGSDEITQNAREQAQAGAAVAGKAVTAMSAINESSKSIFDIINVIDDIAFQTNLLALNAAVEAARAGDQGRGFAVVASEVRGLAGRSAEAAKQIKALIEKSNTRVSEGTQLVNDSGQALGELENSVQKVATFMSEITSASREQAEGIEQVNQAIMDLDEATQQNSALVEQTTAASQAMSEQAVQLNSMLSVFTTGSSSEQAGDEYFDDPEPLDHALAS